MGKNFIGRQTRITIGDNPPSEDNDTVVGVRTDLHISGKDLDKYDHIVGECVEMRIGDDPDAIVQNIRDAIQQSQETRRDEIVAICNEILAQKDQQSKTKGIKTLVTISAGIASIAEFILKLKGLLPPT